MIATPLVGTYQAKAVSQTIVISQVQLGGLVAGSAGQEFVQIHNNSYTDIEITNWCLSYTSASGATTSSLICIRPNDTATKLWLKARSFAMLVSLDYKNSIGGSQGDGIFSNKTGMASSGGRIRLLDASNSEVDRISWGTIAGEAGAPEPANGKTLQRIGNGTFQDTDDSSIDFSISVPSLFPSGVYETITDICPNIGGAQQVLPTGMIFDNDGNCAEPPPADVCPNIPEFQGQVPSGYLTDENGNCQSDSCRNIPGLQINVPDNYAEDSIGDCIERDVCPNVIGAQHTVPEGYISHSSGVCALDLVSLEISEVFPNPKGADSGNEFIELYNPSSESVGLQNYIVQTGVNSDKTFTFAFDMAIGPGEFKIFKDSDLGFTLTNTSGRVLLKTIDGFIIDDSTVYTSAADDMAWAKIDGLWQYTDHPTPGSLNVSSYQDDTIDLVSSGLMTAECAAGKYRNPLTNRCRNIESDAMVLATCDSDQYRNQETGRCKKVVSAISITPCKDGQYRSEETNRCRNISAASATLAPCKEGQERNTETNRCRNLAAKSVPAAAYAIEPVKDGVKAFVGWWAVGGIGSMALGYAGWEWRREVGVWIRRIIHLKVSK
ncbi:lamin tail domain-containing protein [Candidatus Saccharibacteria bacterium]|nr:lamin tail domain-containing protein [Candidatus Saccharibacteria bacterium]